MTTISLPSHAYEEHLPDMLERLGAGDVAEEIALDFSAVVFLVAGRAGFIAGKNSILSRQGQADIFSFCRKLSPRYGENV